jgi:hypothetical protein
MIQSASLVLSRKLSADLFVKPDERKEKEKEKEKEQHDKDKRWSISTVCSSAATYVVVAVLFILSFFSHHTLLSALSFPRIPPLIQEYIEIKAPTLSHAHLAQVRGPSLFPLFYFPFFFFLFSFSLRPLVETDRSLRFELSFGSTFLFLGKNRFQGSFHHFFSLPPFSTLLSVCFRLSVCLSVCLSLSLNRKSI